MARPNVGDWVRFQRAGVLVIGVVEYVHRSEHSSVGAWKVTTSAGEIYDTGILERRPAAPPTEEGRE